MNAHTNATSQYSLISRDGANIAHTHIHACTRTYTLKYVYTNTCLSETERSLLSRHCRRARGSLSYPAYKPEILKQLHASLTQEQTHTTLLTTNTINYTFYYSRKKPA